MTGTMCCHFGFAFGPSFNLSLSFLDLFFCRAEKGLLPDDPRLSEMFMQLAMLDLPSSGEIAVEELASIAALGGP